LARAIEVDPNTLARWERGEQGIRIRNLAKLARALGVELADLQAESTNERLAQSTQLTQAAAVPTVGEYIDEGGVESARSAMRDLLVQENRTGASGLIEPTLGLLDALRERLQVGAFAGAAERDLQAVVGELAEVTGWFAYDAEMHNLVRQMNHEALYWSRLAGDRKIELLTLQNASMHAATIGHPAEALALARSVLESDHGLSTRLRSLFLIRSARALAQRGDWSALPTMAEAKDLWTEGPSPGDPAWAWWIDEREVAWHDAMCRRDLNQVGPALESLERSFEATQRAQARKVFSHRVYLLQGQVDAQAWADAAENVRELTKLDPVRSERTLSLLRTIITSGAPLDELSDLHTT
jgi:transcriptional regulator with XRE-family HTH domain